VGGGGGVGGANFDRCMIKRTVLTLSKLSEKVVYLQESLLVCVLKPLACRSMLKFILVQV